VTRSLGSIGKNIDVFIRLVDAVDSESDSDADSDSRKAVPDILRKIYIYLGIRMWSIAEVEYGQYRYIATDRVSTSGSGGCWWRSREGNCLAFKGRGWRLARNLKRSPFPFRMCKWLYVTP
jgi:hypothetical protein